MTPSGQTVCLCMIVKDEAPVIRRCLDSVRLLIDHWLIVDTGSTDGTQAIVREHFRDIPGELVERPWRDFAHNRTEALALARPHGTYSLIIDADDAMVVPDGFRMPDLAADSYAVDIDFGAIRYSRPQLVKAELGWRYEGVIHEYLVCEAATTSGHLPLVLTINQDGARRRDPDTYKKDAAVLERAVAQETDPFKLSRYTFYLAQSYRDSGQGEKAVPLYLRRAEMGFWEQEVYCSLLYAGRLLAAMGREAGEVLALWRRASETCPDRAEALHAASHHHRSRNEFGPGYAVARPALAISAPPAGLFVETWIYDYGLLDELAVNAYWAGHHRACLDACLRALKKGKMPEHERSRFLDNMRFALDRMPEDATAAVAAPAIVAHRTPPRAAGLPTVPGVINLGSGKDYRDDHLNIDVDATWRPDAVVDLSAVKLGPDGIALKTKRFGDVVLLPGSVDGIIANDVLEHVPDLVALMTTCLGLLRIGGTFTISVPYDLSFGAWQDPTHVRTFNERSWLYYTEWFWYLGWRDVRFVVDRMEHVASPLGAGLRERKVPEEEVLRTPRAIDSMSVTLRKVELSTDDRRTLDHWRDRKRAAEARDTDRADLSAAEAAAALVPAFSEPFDAARDAYCIWIVSRKDYAHSRAFDPVAAVLEKAFSALGGSAPVVRSPDAWAGRTPIVLGAHLLAPSEGALLPRSAVLFNFEQVDAHSPWMTEHYLSLLRRHPVLDYSIRNTRALQAAGVGHARHMPIRAMPGPIPFAGDRGRDVDVLFFGSLNDRRRRIIEGLEARGLATTHLFGVYGAELEAAVRRAKIVINVHYYEAAVFESARVCPLLAMGACVVSEGRIDDPDTADLVDGLVLCPYEEVVERCLALAGNEAERRAVARRGRAAVTARCQDKIVAETFGSTPRDSDVDPVVVGSGTSPKTILAPGEDYFEGLNLKLLSALPAAHRILELGCANGRLGQAYKIRHPKSHWTGVDRVLSALENAANLLDDTIVMDLDDLTLDPRMIERFQGRFDLIVFGDVIEHLKAPRAFLTVLKQLICDGGRLVCCIPNMNHVSVMERFLIGDLSYDENGLLDDTHLRLFSPASTIKTFLDSGWLPSLVDSYIVEGSPEILRLLGNASTHLGVPDEAFRRTALTYQMILDCAPAEQTRPAMARAAPSISVVVPVTNHLQFTLNISRSPGLKEIGAEIIPVYGASSAADGFERGKKQASGSWLIYCHQDVYVPAGSGYAIRNALAAMEDEGGQKQIVGFIGLADALGERFNNMDDVRVSGVMIDRSHRMQHPPTRDALSIDECIVALQKGCDHRIDSSLGWHLWATDLILTARKRGFESPCRIIDVPLFHNSMTGWSLTEEFDRSRRLLFDKHPEMNLLRTLCGSWQR